MKTNAKKLLMTVGLLLLLPLLGAALWLKSMDFNDYRDTLAQEISEATGRSLRIDGELGLDLSLQPTLSVADLRWANAPWAATPEMLSVARLEASVDLWPLFLGQINLRQITLAGATLNLETDADGRGNWRLDGGDSAVPVAPAAEAVGAEDASPGLPQLNRVNLRDLNIVWRGGPDAAARSYHIDHLALRPGTDPARLELDLLARLDAGELTAQGEISRPREVARGGALEVDLRVAMADLDIGLQGPLVKADEQAGMNLAVRAQGKRLSALPGAQALAALPWSLGGVLSNPQSSLLLDDIQATLGSSDLSGRLSWRDSGQRPVLEGELQSRLLDLNEWADKSGAGKQSGAGKAGEQPRVFSDRQLQWAGLEALDARLGLRVAQLRSGRHPLREVDVGLELEDSSLALDLRGLRWLDGRAHGRLKLDARRDRPLVVLNLQARDLEVARLLEGQSGEPALSGRAELQLALKGEGDSPARIMAGLNGDVRLLIGRGKARLGALDRLVGGLSTALGTLAKEGSESVDLNCAAGDFVIKKGLASSRVLVLDTQYSTVRGEGQVNLASEELDLLLTPKPKSVTLNVAVPVEVKGTLSEPSFEPEKIAAGRKVLGVLAAVGLVASPAVAVLALAELGSAGDNPCLALVSAEPKTGSGKSGGDEAADPGNAVEDVVKGVGDALKGLFGD